MGEYVEKNDNKKSYCWIHGINYLHPDSRSLGGKLGVEVHNRLGSEFMGDVARFSLNELQAKLGEKTG